MSFTGFAPARQEIINQFESGWDATGLLALYPNVKGNPPTTAVSWARVNIAHVTSSQQTFAEPGCRRFRRFGVITVQIFTPSGSGSTNFDNLAKIVSDVFEGQTTPNRVIFRNVSPPIEVGNSGLWFQVNISTDFEYDEIK